MADLSNLKIKNTYQNVLQLDGGALQNLLGQTPNPFIVNGNLRYIDGNQQHGYVLKSDGSGNASWGSVSVGDLYISAATLDNTFLRLESTNGSTIVTPVSYWSSDGKGNYANSGLTGNIGVGTTTPNEKLTVVGAISATTDLYLGNSTHSASTITAEEQLILKGRGADNDYMVLKQNAIDFYIDGLQVARVLPGIFDFNSSGHDYDFKINGEDKPIFRVYGTSGEERVRIKDHLAIGGNESISHADSVKWGLAVTGSSLFYSGGTSTPSTAIKAVGNVDISGAVSAHTLYFNTINGGTF